VTVTDIDILKTAIDWAKAEMFSAIFFTIFGLLFLIASVGFWHFGKTAMAKAYVVAGGLLVVIGVGLIISNQMRLAAFPGTFGADAAAFVAADVARAEQTITSYQNVVFKAIPVIIMICAALVLLLKSPVWQASVIVVVAMMAVIMLVDTNASVRLENYRDQLLLAETQK
jgi:hypothetical protein